MEGITMSLTKFYLTDCTNPTGSFYKFFPFQSRPDFFFNLQSTDKSSTIGASPAATSRSSYPEMSLCFQQVFWKVAQVNNFSFCYHFVFFFLEFVTSLSAIAPCFLFLFHSLLLTTIATLVLEDKFSNGAEDVDVIAAEFVLFCHWQQIYKHVPSDNLSCLV